MARVLQDWSCAGFIAVGTGVGDELWHKAGENLAPSARLSPGAAMSPGEVLKEEQETDGR